MMGCRRRIVHLKNEVLSQLLLYTKGPSQNLSHFVVGRVSTETRRREDTIDVKSASRRINRGIVRGQHGAADCEARRRLTKLEVYRVPRPHILAGKVKVRQVYCQDVCHVQVRRL